MDRIIISELEIRCIIGVREMERKNKQKVVVDVSLECDFSKAARSDDLEDTVNYKELKDNICAMVEKSKFFLLEKLAEKIAAMALKVDGVSSVTVRVEKPGALTGARSVGVEITRCRKAGKQGG
jgi:FolB domain-containing protein